MKNLFAAWALLIPAALFSQINTFDANNAGWGATGDPLSPVAAWFATGGNPGGHIRVTDASIGGTWYFDAPPEFTGNKCDAYGKFLHYDQFTSDTSSQQLTAGNPDVLLIGGGFTLAFDNPNNPGLDWTHYDVPLIETAGWRLNNNNGPPATAAQMRAALADVVGLRIRGEYRSQDDFGGLDNVVFESAFRFDLDGDDSSGAPNGDFWADTICAPPARIADADAVLTSEAAIDSIQIQLLSAAGLETIAVGALPASVAATVFSNSQITLLNTGGATAADLLSALQNLSYQDFSPQPTRGVRLVAFRVFTGCGEAAAVHARVPYFPAVTTGPGRDTALCAGSAPLSLTALLAGGPDPSGYWQPTTTAAGVFDPARDQPGVFAYIVPDAGDCPGDTAWVSVALRQGFRLRPDTTICYDDTLVLTVPPGLDDWQWSDGSRTATLAVTAPGVFALAGRVGECVFSDSVAVDFFTCRECPFYAPNVFSPNDDGENDDFQVFLGCVWSNFRLEIYDRWGGLVFVSDDPEAGWNGRIRGKETAPGVYFWRAEWEGELFGAPQKVQKKGDVSLIR